MRLGWYARRRGILEHLERGAISLLDSAIHDFLCLIADHRTGVAWASAEKIRALCPVDISLKAIQRSLAKLESLRWIKRFRTHGKKGNYPIVIGRYFVRDSSLKWWAVNLDRTSDFRNVHFDPVTDPSFVKDWARTSSDTGSGTELGTDDGSELSPEVEVSGEISEGRIQEGVGEGAPENGAPAAQDEPRPSRFAFSGPHFVVSVRQDQSLADAFPWVDRQSEYKKASSWLEANPGRRPKKNSSRFLHNWFARIPAPSNGARGGLNRAEKRDRDNLRTAGFIA